MCIGPAQLPGFVIERNRGVSINEVDEKISGVVAESLSTLAEQIISEKDAEAAAMREVFGELLRYLHTVSDDRAVGFSAPMPVDVLENAEATLDSSTTGRDLLAELASLREQSKQLTAGTAELRRYVEGNGFTWQEDETTVFNVTTAIGWLGGTVGTLRERVRELVGALNLPREQLAMLSRPMQSITITPEGE